MSSTEENTGAGRAEDAEPRPGVVAGAEQASSAGDADVAREFAETDGDVAGAEPAEAGPDEQLAEALRERDEYLSLAQRARADFENLRKRSLAQTKDAEIRGKAELAKALIPAVDNLERALLASGIAPDAEDRAREAADHPSEVVSPHEMLGRGVAMVLGELQASLAKAGVESFDPVGERFDPENCEALSMRPAEDGGSGDVLETLEKGYRIDGRVLRPARVVVGT
ncbi:nucleotide exchange factor GrpE [Thermoleophilia bacterium SCSIO 60948]|nr:nucleotide exchange factor GrpE [Thermoleophilia bacterium SCSIO 60948]